MRGARLGSSSITPAQLAATASYQAHDLTGIDLSSDDLTNADFVGQKLTGASFSLAKLTGAKFMNAEIRGADFTRSVNYTNDGFVGTGISASQLYSTASYQARDLMGIKFTTNDLGGALLAGQNLSNSSLSSATLTGAGLEPGQPHQRELR